MEKVEAKAEVKAKVEYIPIEVPVHIDFEGKRVIAAKRYPKAGVVFNCLIAVPRNEDESQKFYNCSMQEIFEKGVIQLGYSEGVWSKDPKGTRTGIKEVAEDSNTDVLSEEFQAMLGQKMNEALASPKTRMAGSSGTKAKIAEMQSAYQEYGLDYKVHTIKDLEKAIVAKLTGKKSK